MILVEFELDQEEREWGRYERQWEVSLSQISELPNVGDLITIPSKELSGTRLRYRVFSREFRFTEEGELEAIIVKLRGSTSGMEAPRQ